MHIRGNIVTIINLQISDYQLDVPAPDKHNAKSKENKLEILTDKENNDN